MKRRDIFTILDELGSGLDELKNSLQRLGTVVGREGTRAVRRASKRMPKIRRNVRKGTSRTLSASVKSLRVMQGQYMSLLRRLSKAQQRQVKKIRKSDGYQAALRFLSLKKR